ncbi:MAG: A24 family peptidase [Candidatus Diapherotrites archaeon]|nr:A24 family peptidase [Candidatus Diapherotrites archaeon]
MGLFLFFFLFSLIALIIATISDLRERLVSNRLTAIMVAVGLTGHAVWALWAGDYWIFANSLLATIGTFLFALLLYKAGVWAGGDVKLFAGIAALNPFSPSVLYHSGLLQIHLLQPIELPVFPFTLFVFSVVAMLPYSIFLALKRLGEHKKHTEKVMRSMRLFGTGFAVVAVLCVAALAADFKDAAFLLAYILAAWGLLFLLRLYSLSKLLMRKAIKITELEEEMIAGEAIIESGGKVERVEEAGIKKLIKGFVDDRLSQAATATERKREIVSSLRAGGVTKEEIKELRGLVKRKKLQNIIMVKESAPFVPGVFIAYAALAFIGDALWRILL